jgi:hypothetical protein
MSSVDQPLGLLPQVQHRWIIWWSLVVAVVELTMAVVVGLAA